MINLNSYVPVEFFPRNYFVCHLQLNHVLRMIAEMDIKFIQLLQYLKAFRWQHLANKLQKRVLIIEVCFSASILHEVNDIFHWSRAPKINIG